MAVRAQNPELDPAALGEGAGALSFSAAFVLRGSPTQGELSFFTPLGSTAASVVWHAQEAQWTAQGRSRSYSSLQDLMSDLLKTDLPAPALFAWLHGQTIPADPWHADLSQWPQGRIHATRSTWPQAEVRIVLER